MVYRNYGGPVIFTGGVQIRDWSKLENTSLIERLPRSARPYVVVTQLDDLGVDPGALSARRLHQEMSPRSVAAL